MATWRPIDHDAVHRQMAGRCFICELLSGTPDYQHAVFYEDADTIAFLSKYPTLIGYSLVAPRAHRERVTADFSLAEYLAIQRVIYRVGEAIRQVVPTERLYVLSLGSQQGNRHVHWHVVPLPPGVPFEQQQYTALHRDGYLLLSEKENPVLVARLRSALMSGSVE